MATTAGCNQMASANGIQVFCNWHQAWKAVPKGMSGFASAIATKAKAAQGAIGAQGCWNDWLKPIEVPEAGRTGFHQDNRNYRLPLTSDSIKFQKIGSKLRWDLEEQMAYVMVIHVYCWGEQVEQISLLINVLNAGAEFTVAKYFKWNWPMQNHQWKNYQSDISARYLIVN